MIKSIRKSGNSASITIDQTLLDLIHAKIGDKVNVTVHNGSLIISPVNVGFSEDEINEAAAAVFKRYGKTFKKLAE